MRSPAGSGGNAPSSPTADVAKNALTVKQCYEQVWSQHKGALASPLCHNLTLSGDPDKDEVDQALYGVGRGPAQDFGRWTLAD